MLHYVCSRLYIVQIYFGNSINSHFSEINFKFYLFEKLRMAFAKMFNTECV